MGLLCALVELAYAVVNVLAIPVYVSKELGLGGWVGIVMGAFLLAEAVGRLWLGALSDVVGRRPLIFFGPIMSAAGSFLVMHTANPYLLVGVRVFDGLGAAAFWPAVFAAVGDHTSEENRSTGMSVLNVAYMVGLAFGPLAGGWVNSLYSTPGHPVYHAAFYLSTALFIGAAVMALLVVPRKAVKSAAHAPAHAQEEWTGFGPMASAAIRVWRLMLLAFITFLGIGLLIPVLELYALDRFGITQETFGKLFVVPAVVISLVAVPLGRLGDRWGRLASIRCGMFLCATALWALPFVNSHLILAGGAILVGIGFLLAFPAWMALVADVTDEQARGSVLGAAGMAQGFGAIIGAVAGGQLYHWGRDIFSLSPHDVPIYLSAAFLSLSWLLSLVILGSFQQRSRSTA
ncbi:MAG: MFS transporter [Armatimonadetes bacterium]|nr:MFS transporter [Armatimonadota bacterium]